MTGSEPLTGDRLPKSVLKRLQSIALALLCAAFRRVEEVEHGTLTLLEGALGRQKMLE